MSEEAETIIDWAAFSGARSDLGADFVRILGYFREDGAKSVSAIEGAMRALDAAAMVLPAHTLKGEASQFGAEALADLAENIETIARQSVEWRQAPDEALPDVVKLRDLFNETLAAFERETNPLVERRRFGRKVEAANQRFGQI
ncbi:MAG: Hpt protein [Sphingomonadales bacterium]|nr:Hpt protein [Sphingomonadales bacterium]